MTLSPGWTLVKDRAECAGDEIYPGEIATIEDCASECKGISSMFAFGTNDYGASRCLADGSKCNCLCETAASSNGVCQESAHSGYRLYAYQGNLIIKQR